MINQTKKLSIAFYWHMHQPVYQLTPDGDYVMPWVRLHAIKDYLDMVEILDKFKKLKLNFNLVPVLLDALEDYAIKGMHDIHSRLTIMPVEELSDDDKLFILNNFFDANYKNMILPFEEYDRLYHKIQNHQDYNIDLFNNQEYSDLMALFNLVWFDPVYLSRYPNLKKIYKKGKNYTLQDRISIINIQREIIKEVIPAYKKYMMQGRIELTTSPYYHPILPILVDEEYLNGNIEQSEGFYSDAVKQVELAKNRFKDVFSTEPKGMWLPEHCIDVKTLKVLSDLGIKWTVSDEGILANSMNFEFIRDFKGHLKEPYHLVKTYNYKTDNSDINLIFRDNTIPNLIGFEYSNYNPIAAANDLYDRIKTLQTKLLTSPDRHHLLTIAMDGENCWENYTQDGLSFLKTIYKLIEDDDTLETVLVSDYLGSVRGHKLLTKVASGSWISRDFKFWHGEPLKDLAWNYLKQVRSDFLNFKSENPNYPNLDLAEREILICEGSDWFWWFGEPNDSGRDNVFDYLFREHLKNVYLYLNLNTPPYLDEPLTNNITKPLRNPIKSFTPKITGVKEDDSWLNSGCIDIPDGAVFRKTKLFDKICFGCDDENFYLRFYLNKFIQDNKDLQAKTYQMYVYTRNATKKQAISPIRLINKTENTLPLSLENFHNEIQISIQNNELKLVRNSYALAGNVWVLRPSKEIQTAYNNVLDLSIPFDLLDVNRGETMEFIFINANFGIQDFCIPNETVLSITRE